MTSPPPLCSPPHSAPLAAVLACALSLTAAAGAQFDLPGQPRGEQPSADRLVQARVLTDRGTLGPLETLNLLVVFDIEPGWHIYWHNPGEGAAAPTIDVSTPESLGVGQIRWPRPKVIKSPVGDMYGYEGSAALFVPISSSAQVHDGIAVITTDISFAVCDNRMCFFGRKSIRTTVYTSRFKTGEPSGSDLPRIDQHRKRLPVLVKDSDDATAELIGEGESRQLIINGPAHDFEAAEFYPFSSPGVTYQRPKFSFEEDRFTAVIDLKVNRANFTHGSPTVGGVVGLGRRSDGLSYEVELPLGDGDEGGRPRPPMPPHPNDRPTFPFSPDVPDTR